MNHLLKDKLNADTKSIITKKNVPTMLEILAAKSETILKSIKSTLVENLYGSFIPLGKSLTKEFGADDVAASLIKAIFDKGINYNYAEDVFNKTDNSINKTHNAVSTAENVRLFLSIGKMDEVMTKDIIFFLCETANINKTELGRIDIFDKFSFSRCTWEIS